ncbi:low temperature requirement protein A [Micromonospora sp. NBC_01699]|uniref:low temperature requirement protein A n=1 Tax=Micromonospora sp. NBC_01699 TaxID=2975984 RepID=UPI002E2CB3AC|nr:low temperature requirement protein A [Micromonospora sp. NBC_01699]
MPGRQAVHLRKVAPGARVERLEVFFDLVFVFAFFNIARVVSSDLSVDGLIRGLLVLALLWWCWCSHMICANRVRLSEGVAPVVIFVVMAATLAIALSIPEAFADAPGGVNGSLIFAGCYLVIRGLHLMLYWLAAHDDPGMRRQLHRFAIPMLVATALLVAASLVPRELFGLNHVTIATILFALAVAVEYGVGPFIGVSGWTVASAGHWVERFELIIIIALGETIISVGVGSDLIGRPVTWPALVAAALGISLTATLWWAYFDIIGTAAQQTMHATHGPQRVRLARDAYIYLHLPMITALILLALGAEELLAHLGVRHIDVGAPQPGPGVPLIYSGVALFFLGHLFFQLSILGTVAWSRVATIVLLIALIPLAVHLPALAAMALLAIVCITLVIVEVLVFSGARRALREADRQERTAHEERETDWRRERYE